MKYEEKKCTICETRKVLCIYETPVVRIIKLPKEDHWIVALRRHTSLPLKGEIKCIKYAVKKIFPKNAKVERHQQEPFGHFHWIVEGEPINRAKKYKN